MYKKSWQKGRVLSPPRVYGAKVGFWGEISRKRRLCISDEKHKRLDLIFLDVDKNICVRGRTYTAYHIPMMQVEEIKLLPD